MVPTPLILDTDGGVDDALALLLALQSPGEIDLKLITVVAGNVPVEQAHSNILRVLRLWQDAQTEQHGRSGATRRPLPAVVAGAEKPLKVKLRTAVDVHGSDGFGGAAHKYSDDLLDDSSSPGGCEGNVEGELPLSSAAESMLGVVEDAWRLGNRATIVTVGPLTNVAHAIQRDAARMALAKEIVVMGGAFEEGGNVSKTAEYNIHTDPDAAQVVCQWAGELGVPLVFVPLDVTEKVEYLEEEFQRFADRGGPFAKFSVRIHTHIFGFMEGIGRPRSVHMHDPLAVALALACPPDIDELDEASPVVIPRCERYRRRTRVDVECCGTLTSGMTVGDVQSPRRFPVRNNDLPLNAFVCMQVNGEYFKALFDERVLAFGCHEAGKS